MAKVKTLLKGRKTYIVAVLMVLVGVVNLVAGDTTLVDFVGTEHFRLLLEGTGLASLRAGVSKVK